jgi:hypothetical protein
MENEMTVTQAPLEFSPEIGELAAALAIAQGVMKSAKKESTNPYFKSNYADLSNVWDSCREALSRQKLAVLQPTSGTNENVTVNTMIVHASGQWVRGSLTLRPVKSDPQGVGSAITYARRYALAAMVGVVADDDDDGNAASGKVDMPQRKSEAAIKQVAEIVGAKPTNVISDAQRKRLFALCKEAAVEGDILKEYLVGNYTIDSTNLIKKEDYQSICEWVQSQRQPGQEG